MLYYIKGVDFIMKYVMFGFDKVKNDKLPDNFAYLMTFVTDLENVCFYLLYNYLGYLSDLYYIELLKVKINKNFLFFRKEDFLI